GDQLEDRGPDRDGAGEVQVYGASLRSSTSANQAAPAEARAATVDSNSASLMPGGRRNASAGQKNGSKFGKKRAGWRLAGPQVRRLLESADGAISRPLAL